jgi:glycerophosphoryl diester phosphodiesterase
MVERPLVIARTGDVENAPENTLPAFESAIAKGADGVELDVHLTADHELVVHHFYSLGATDDGEGLVCEHTLAELKALDSGGWFDERFAGEPKPTLAEVLELCQGRTRLEVHLHDPSIGFLRQVIDEIERFDLVDTSELTTAHYPLLQHVKKVNPELRTGTFFHEPPEWMPIRLAQRHIVKWADLLGLDVVHLDLTLITTNFVEELHHRRDVVHGANLDAAEDIGRGLERGVDQFSTGCLRAALQLRDELTTRRARDSTRVSET